MPLSFDIVRNEGNTDDDIYAIVVVGMGVNFHIFELHYSEPNDYKHYLISQAEFPVWVTTRAHDLGGQVRLSKMNGFVPVEDDVEEQQ